MLDSTVMMATQSSKACLELIALTHHALALLARLQNRLPATVPDVKCMIRKT